MKFYHIFLFFGVGSEEWDVSIRFHSFHHSSQHEVSHYEGHSRIGQQGSIKNDRVSRVEGGNQKPTLLYQMQTQCVF